MILCTNCSEQNPDTNHFCRNCGEPLNNIITKAAGPATAVPATGRLRRVADSFRQMLRDTPVSSRLLQDSKTATGLSLNISIALSYLWIWVSGIAMLIIERRNRTICFHACQSIVTFGAITVFLGLLTLIPPVPYGIIYILLMAVWVIFIAVGAYLWILLLVKSFTGRPYSLPVIGNAALHLDGWYQEKLGISQEMPVEVIDMPGEKAAGSKYCTGCRKVIPERAVFCPECGEKQLQEVMARIDQLGRTIESERSADADQRVTTATRKALDSTVNAVTIIGEKRDPYTAGHQRRVTALALAIAHDMNLTQEQLDGLSVAGQLHDIGKISVPSDILNKPGKLSDGEMTVIRGHSQASYDILKGIEFPWPVAQIAYQHHERLDGSGYPRGLKDERILLEAKVLCVADVVEAMASHRPYRPALGIDKALDEIVKNKGKLYDPDIVDCCVRLFRENRFSFD
jgi:uncharacterized membrane protein